MLKLTAFLSLFCFLLLMPTKSWSTNKSITKISIVEQLCKEKSEEIITEQGIDVISWQAQTFNGDRTFNIEGLWKTNAGSYIAECELPFGSSKTSLSLILTKS